MLTCGIDLGTSNSAIAFHHGDITKVITLPSGKTTMPSAVAFLGDNLFIGDEAIAQAARNLEHTFTNYKRLMGVRYNDDIDMGPQVVKGDLGFAALRGPDKTWHPAELSGLVLEKLKEAAEKEIGETLDRAVITHPSYFDEEAKRATMKAGELAGFKEVHLLGEPTAAAIAYGLDHDKFSTVAVFDLGGGTFDVSIMEIGKGFHQHLATNGDTRLGGLNFDEEIARWLVDQHKEQTGVDLSADAYRFLRLMRSSERTKITLTTKNEADVELAFAYVNAEEGQAPVHIKETLSRDAYEALVEHLVMTCLKSTKLAMVEAKRSAAQIDAIILVGGMTRVPMIREAVQAFFNKKPRADINPDEIVAIGAAIKGAALDERIASIMEADILPMSIGIETAGGNIHQVVSKGTAFGFRAEATITNVKEAQSCLAIGVYQGDKPRAADNKLIQAYTFELPEGLGEQEAELQLVFNIDANGLLTVHAHDLTQPEAAAIVVYEGAFG